MSKIIYLSLLLVKLALAVTLLSGCKKQPVTSSEKEKNDSSSVKERIVTNTVYLPGERIPFEVPCPDAKRPGAGTKEKKTFTKNGGSVTTSVGSDGVVRGYVDCPDLKHTIEEQKTEIYRLKQEKEKKQDVVVEYKTRTIDIVCRWATVLLLAYILIKHKIL